MLQVKIDEKIYEIPYSDGTYQAGVSTVTVKSSLVTITHPDWDEEWAGEVFTEEGKEDDPYPVNF